MTSDKIKEMMDACYQAKRVRDLMPSLPNGVTSAYIRYIDRIGRLTEEKKLVKISDISNDLGLPKPGVTRTINEMVEKGYLKKQASNDDGRITYITITKKGEELSEKYIEKFYKCLYGYLEDVSDEDADVTIRTIEKLYMVMSERKIEIG